MKVPQLELATIATILERAQRSGDAVAVESRRGDSPVTQRPASQLSERIVAALKKAQSGQLLGTRYHVALLPDDAVTLSAFCRAFADEPGAGRRNRAALVAAADAIDAA